MIFLALWFSFVNPVLEEFFWRVFLRWELRDPCCGVDVAGGESRPMDLEGNVDDQLDDQPPEICKILVSCYFASYHVVVVLFFLQWYWAVLAGVGLAVTGRLLVWVQEDKRYGLMTSLGAHVGLDVAFCFIVAQIYFKIVQGPFWPA